MYGPVNHTQPWEPLGAELPGSMGAWEAAGAAVGRACQGRSPNLEIITRRAEPTARQVSTLQVEQIIYDYEHIFSDVLYILCVMEENVA